MGRDLSPSSASGGAPRADVFDRRFELRDRREDIESLQQSMLEAAERLGYDQTSRFAIRLALEEAISNGFKHGNKDDPGKTVAVHVRIGPDEAEIDVRDQGEGFDPETVPDPTLDENIEIPAGRGIILMRAYMTTVRFHPPGNRVEMRFVRESH